MRLIKIKYIQIKIQELNKIKNMRRFFRRQKKKPTYLNAIRHSRLYYATVHSNVHNKYYVHTHINTSTYLDRHVPVTTIVTNKQKIPCFVYFASHKCHDF